MQFLDWLGHPLLYNDRCLGLTEQKTVDSPQLQCSDKVNDVPVVQVVVRVEGASDSSHRWSWVRSFAVVVRVVLAGCLHCHDSQG